MREISSLITQLKDLFFLGFVGVFGVSASAESKMVTFLNSFDVTKRFLI
jgi:hypothetical protein